MTRGRGAGIDRARGQDREVSSTEPDLDELAREFDHTLASMQTDEAAAFDALFEMGPEELGRAAVQGARGDDR